MKFTRCLAAALAIASATVVTVTGATTSHAAAPQPAAAGAFDCLNGALAVSTPNPTEALTTRRVGGPPLDEYVTIRNTETKVLPTAGFTFEFGNMDKNRGPVPTVWWRVAGKGSWHKMAFHWNAKTQGNLPLWDSARLPLGTIGAHGSTTVEVSVYFPRGSVKDGYSNFWEVGSAVCGTTDLGWFMGREFQLWPWSGLPGSPVY
ncbi:hypothetical protein [Streptacidiphilus melanogenes]|uniref:hypothetical protein n=1 Tax=Streptacidiphilus melanogenes TaxID=411235 RepID=UPI0005AA190C|nr:hypothetical protein [Streptacidiphilus melanogenes]